MRLPNHLILIVSTIAVFSNAASAQGIPPGLSLTGAQSPLKNAFLMLANPWVILFVIFALGWALFYMMYRMGLERSGSIPTAYRHKLASVLSAISILPLLWFYSRNPDAEQFVRAFATGWPGFAITLMGAIMVGTLTYYCLSGWWRAPAGPGP